MSKVFPPPNMSAHNAPLPDAIVNDRDAKRGYSINNKQAASAFALEAIVIVLSLVAAWLFAEQNARDTTTKIMMMLGPIAFAVAEASRVPLAMVVRTQPSFHMKVVALVAVLCTAGVTTKTVSQLADFMYRSRLTEVTEERAALNTAKSTLATIDAKTQALDQDLARLQSDLSLAQARVTAASADVGKLPPMSCVPAVARRRGGGLTRTTACTIDPRNASMTNNLADANVAVGTVRQRIEVARKGRAAIDPAAATASVAAKDVAYRKALFNSQPHSFAGMVYGKDAAELTDGEVNAVLRIFVFVPSILVALSSTLLAMTAVVRLPPPAETMIDIPDEGLLRLLTPMREEIIRSAAEAVATEVTSTFTTKARPGSSHLDATSTGPVATPPNDPDHSSNRSKETR